MNDFQPINNMSELLLIIKKELGIEAFSKKKSKELYSIAYMLDYAPHLKSEIDLLKIAISADVYNDFSPAINSENVNIPRIKIKLQERYFLNEKSIDIIIKWFSILFDVQSFVEKERLDIKKETPNKTNLQNDDKSLREILLQNYHNLDYEFLVANYLSIFRLAGKNDSDAQYFAGLCYHQGIGVPKNYQIAKQLYEKSIQKENPAAMNNLGTLFEEQKNYKLAKKYYQMAIEHRFALSFRNMCILKLSKLEPSNSGFKFSVIDEYAYSCLKNTEKNKYLSSIEFYSARYICAYLGATNAISFAKFINSQRKYFSEYNVNLFDQYLSKSNVYLETIKIIEQLFYQEYEYIIQTVDLVINDVQFISSYYKKLDDAISVSPKYVEHEESHDGTYSGYMLSGNRYGKGQLVLNNGDVYEGEFLENRYHGKGKYTKKDGFVYEGEFCRGKFHGKGKLIYANQSVYEGDFSDGEKHGYGKYTNSDGAVYEGEYCKGKWHGKGKITYSDQRVYEGDFCDGKIHGHGKMLFPNAGLYSGEFKNSKFHGEGALTFDDGTTFDGTFENGEITKSGKIIRKNGQIIEGKKAIWLAKKLRKLFGI